MANRLTDLSVHEVSLVPHPANKGATILLFKSADAPPALKVDAAVSRLLKAGIEAAPAATEADPLSADIAKRFGEVVEYSKLAGAASDATLADGSFSIATAVDLRKAMAAIGVAKDPAAAKAHIRKRANALGLAAELTPAFKGGFVADLLTQSAAALGITKDDGTARDFDAVQDAVEAAEYADGMMSEIWEAVSSLRTSVNEIMCDDGTPNKADALKATFDQFKAHMQGVVPEWLEKTLGKGIAGALSLAKAGIAGGTGAGTMKLEDIAKTLGLPATATETEVDAAIIKAAAAAKTGEAVLKMSGPHAAFMSNDKAKMPKGGKAAFAEMSPEDRAAHMKANPLPEDAKKGDEGLTDLEKSLQTLPEDVRKMILSNNEKVAKLEDEKSLSSTVVKMADFTLVGKAEDLGALVHSIRKADPASADAVTVLLQQTQERLSKSSLFTEAGSGLSGFSSTGNANSQIDTLAKEMMAKGVEKTASGGPISIEKARGLVRKRNPELAKQEEADAQERRSRARR